MKRFLPIFLALALGGCADSVVAPSLGKVRDHVVDADQRIERVLPHVSGQDHVDLFVAHDRLSQAIKEVDTKQQEIDKLAVVAAEVPKLREELVKAHVRIWQLWGVLAAELAGILGWLWYRGTLSAVIAGIKGGIA